MIRVRVCMIAGLTAVAAVVTADAFAQECPEWLKWLCPGDASSTAAARYGVRQERQLSRANATGPAMDRRSKHSRTVAAATVTNSKSQKQAPEPAGAAMAADRSPNRAPSRERSAQHEARQDPAITEQAKEELFRKFLEWQNSRRLNADTHR
jgi:hypothetical protein